MQAHKDGAVAGTVLKYISGAGYHASSECWISIMNCRAVDVDKDRSTPRRSGVTQRRAMGY